MKRYALWAFVWLMVGLHPLFSGTTGKIAGTVTDAETGEPLIGVNIVVEGTLLGAATDEDGYYVILNVPPGRYTVKASYIGYREVIKRDVLVQIDLTTRLDFELVPTTLEMGEAIIVEAERPVVQVDISGSTANIEKRQIDALPVQSLTEAIGLQPGILGGLSIRGGSSDEVAFIVDGITLRDERNNTPITGISLSAVQDVQIQTSGFNAEFGNIRSGVVKVVTKEGDPNKYSATINYQYSYPTPKHFGPSFNDPNTYWLRPYLDPAVAYVGTKNGGWDENMQNDYPAFDGWREVAARTLADDDPTNDLTPEGAKRVFMWQHRRQLDIVKPDYVIDVGFGGPVPFISKPLGKLRFYASYRGEREMYLIPLSRDAYQDHSFMLKLNSDITNRVKLTVLGVYNKIAAVANNDVGEPGYFRSTTSIAGMLTRAGFSTRSRIFYDSYWALTDVDRYNVSAKITHTLSSSSFYEAKLEYTRVKYFTRPNAPRDTTKKYEIVPGYFVDEAPFGHEERIVNGIDGMLMGVRANARDFSTINTLTFKADYTNQLNQYNLVKTGIELVYDSYHMNYGAINKALPTGRPWTKWDRDPLRGAFYIQDKIEYQDFICNVGVRLDYIDPRGTWYDIDPFDRRFFTRDFQEGTEDQFPQKPVKKQLYISPRLGVSFPINVNTKLFFNYGHFRQMPPSNRMFNVQRVTDRSVSIMGDPNLPLQKTVAYELGFEQSLLDMYLIRLATYYKDITNQPNLVRYIGYGQNSAVNYRKAEANFYEDIRGFEVSVEKRVGRWFTGFFNFTYQVSTFGYFGTLEVHEQRAAQQQYERENPAVQYKPVPRPYSRLSLQFHTPENFGGKYGNIRPFASWNISLLGVWRAGQRFTWTNNIDIPGLRYNMKWKDYVNVDLRISRNFEVKPFRFKFFLNISNLFNFKYWPYLGVGPSGFVDGNDFMNYMRSLRLPKELADEFNYVPKNGYGNDRPGDYRPLGVPYDPLEPNPNNDPEIEARNRERIRKKSYIDNPAMTYLQFLNPRDIYMGIEVSFDLK